MNAVKPLENYYLSLRPQTNEIHSIHKEGCPFMPDDSRRISLGKFESGEEAGYEGKKYFVKSCTCRYCVEETGEKPLFENACSDYLPSEKQLAQQLRKEIYYSLN